MKEITDLPGKEQIVERNGFLKRSGTIDRNVYFIETGSVRAFVLDHEEEQIIRFGYSGNIIVPLDSYLTGKPSPIAIQAIKRSKVKIIARQEIENFIRAEANLNWWAAILENLVLQQMEREVDVLTSSPKERYERVLKRSPRLFQEIPNRYIANYLRMSAETLSRLKKS